MMKTKFVFWLAIVLILQIGLIHLMTAQGEYEEAPYLGYLFAANFFAALFAAYGIYRRQRWGWLLGLLIVVGSLAGYIWSRTLGMPGMHVEEWFNPYGIVALSLEGIFVLLFLLRPWKIPAADAPTSRGNNFLRYLLPITGVSTLVLISAFTYRWDVNVTQAFGQHIGSLDQVRELPVTPIAELEQQNGVQVALVANSMMDSIVDVRLRIVDPQKAHALLQNQAALLVDGQSLVLAPHMHSHVGSRLKVGKMFIIFFPTQQEIHRGSEVSLVFGSERVEPFVVR
jgi:hypothetical protein